MLATGGSDFHGLNKMAHMGALGQVQAPPEVVGKLKEKADEIKETSRRL